MAALTAAPEDLTAQVRAAIDAGYGVVAVDPRKATVLLVAAAGDGPLRERRNKLVTEYADLVIDGLPLLAALGRAERRRAQAVALFLIGGSCDVIEAVLAGRVRMSRGAAGRSAHDDVAGRAGGEPARNWVSSCGVTAAASASASSHGTSPTW